MEKRDPITGQFIKGSRGAALENRNHAQMIYKALKALATPEWVTRQVEELVAQGGQVQRATLEMVLAYTVGKPTERIELSAGQGTSWNVDNLTPDEQASLQAIALKTLTAPPTLIDAEFAPVETEAN